MSDLLLTWTSVAGSEAAASGAAVGSPLYAGSSRGCSPLAAGVEDGDEADDGGVSPGCSFPVFEPLSTSDGIELELELPPLRYCVRCLYGAACTYYYCWLRACSSVALIAY